MPSAARRSLLCAALALGGGLLGGCAGLTGGSGAASTSSRSSSHAPPAPPSGRPQPGSPAAKLAQAQRTHEYPGAPQHQTAASGASRPVPVIQAFATAYINWTAGTVAPTMRALEQISVGQARSELALEAAQTAQDYELRTGGIANSGVVEAIAPVLGHPDQYAVVTRELTTATHTTAYQGLHPAWHLALATVIRLRPGQWVLSSWQPEN